MLNTKLDIFVDKLDSLSDKPIKKIFNTTRELYIDQDKLLDKSDLIFNEFLYFYLNDPIDGCEFNVLFSGYEDEVELLRDVIAISSEKKTIAELVKGAQKIRMNIVKLHKRDDEKILNHLNRFVFMCFCFDDERYIDYLVEHFVKTEKISPDDLIHKINTRVMKNENVVLKINDEEE